MAHSHSHDHHHHDHSHTNADTRTLIISFGIISTFMVVEYIGGYLTGSLALMADAGHMLNDSLGLAVALLALTWARKWAKHLAVANGVSLLAVAALVLWEAWQRWQNPNDLSALPMLAIAVLGLAANVIVAKIMMRADRGNTNIQAAYLHVLADLAGSAVAIAAALGSYFFGWYWVDILASAALGILVGRSGWQITRKAWREFQAA